MRTVVFAYHEMGRVGLQALLDHGFEVVAVFTHRDEPGEKVPPASVAELAAEREIPVFTPDSLKHPLWEKRLRDLTPDIFFSFYYRKLIPGSTLEIAPQGGLNLHGSLLPEYRGRCPVNWVLIHGEQKSGVTLHHMTPRADDGDIVGQQEVPIAPDDTAPVLYAKLQEAGRRLLDELLPLILAGKAPRRPQDHERASYFGGRTPADGLIRWEKPAQEIHNLVRALACPYPGAFTNAGEEKLTIWKAAPAPGRKGAVPGTVLSVAPFRVACGQGSLEVLQAQAGDGVVMAGKQAAGAAGLVAGSRLGMEKIPGARPPSPTRVLILGVGGFIGNSLVERLLSEGNYAVFGMDLHSENIKRFLGRKNFHFVEGDININREWIEYHVRKCDVILPLVAIATPIEYVRNPLRVFELDFEENLRIVRYCARFHKRLVFPSTSEVYGMCPDEEFDEQESNLVTGPIRMQRWIYSCSKQLLDRVIWAYGATRGLGFTLFRPFNWIGPRLDSLDSARIGSSRAITQLILNLVTGTPIKLVDGGAQKRCFTDVRDGIECLFRIIADREGKAAGEIFNIGNPDNEASIAELAETLTRLFRQHPLAAKFPPPAGMTAVESDSYYGKGGYQDVVFRKPSIANARRKLHWKPEIGLEEAIRSTLDFFLQEAAGEELPPAD